MTTSRIVTLALAALCFGTGAARADVYDEVKVLAEPKRANELEPDAQKRWKSGLAKLDQVPGGALPDYRQCAYRALLQFRLGGPAANGKQRYACTAALVSGVVASGSPQDAGARANIINVLGQATDTYYEAELARLREENAELERRLADSGGGTVDVSGAIAWINALRVNGKISGATALKLMDNVGSLPARDLTGRTLQPIERIAIPRN
jgi:hypothetical protein